MSIVIENERGPEACKKCCNQSNQEYIFPSPVEFHSNKWYTLCVEISIKLGQPKQYLI